MTLTFELWRDFCTVYLTAKFDRPTFSRSEFIVRTNKLTNKQTPPKTSTSLRYATPVGNYDTPFTRYNRFDNWLYTRYSLLSNRPVECLYTRYNLLSNRFHNRFDNRLYCVNGASMTRLLSCWTDAGMRRLSGPVDINVVSLLAQD